MLLPYWSLYLQRLGFAPAAIGLLLALGFAVKLVAPYLWSWLADRSGQRRRLLRAASVAATLSFCGVFAVEAGAPSLPLMALTLLAFHFFWQALLPQFEALTLTRLGRDAHRYGWVRLWGSVGFIVASVGLGALLPTIGIERLPLALLLAMVAVCCSASCLPAAPAASTAADAAGAGLGGVLRRRGVIVLLLTAVLVQASHGPYYGFFSIHAEQLGYRSGAVGLLWSLGVIAEILVFALAPALLARSDPRALLLLTLALTALRWLLIGFVADRLPLLLLAQLLHGFSYGLHHVVSIQLIHRWFTGPVQGRGQALFGSLSFGVGGACGAWVAGLLWQPFGAAGAYLWAAALCAAAWLLVAVGLPADRPGDDSGRRG